MGTLVSFGLPLYTIYSNLIRGQETKVIYSISTALILFILFLVISRWIMKIYERKLQAIATAEEIGVVPITNFIVIRILRQLEVLLPIGIIGIMIYGMSFIGIPPYLVFADIAKWILLGLVFYLVHDWLKVYYINKNLVEDQLILQDNVNRLRERRHQTEIRRRRRRR